MSSGEKNSETLYPILFCFKGFADVISMGRVETSKDPQNKELREMLSDKVFKIFESPVVSKIMVSILSETMDKNFVYSKQIFNVICYFLNSLMFTHPSLKQRKFVKVNLDSDDFLFFSKHGSELIKLHMMKTISKDSALFNRNSLYSDEVVEKGYLIDTNLEKQAITLLKHLFIFQDPACKEANNYLLAATIQKLALEYSKKLCGCMHYPVAFDILIASLETLAKTI